MALGQMVIRTPTWAGEFNSSFLFVFFCISRLEGFLYFYAKEGRSAMIEIG